LSARSVSGIVNTKLPETSFPAGVCFRNRFDRPLKRPIGDTRALIAMPLKTKLIILFMSFILVPLVLFGAVVFYRAQSMLTTLRIAQLNNIVDLKKDKIETFFSERTADIRSTQNYLNIKRNLPVLSQREGRGKSAAYAGAMEELDGQLKPFQRDSGYLNVMLADARGRVVYATDAKRGSRFLNRLLPRKSYDAAKQGIYFTDVSPAGQGGKNTIWGMAPLHSLGGAFIGEAAIVIDMDPIYAFIRDSTGLGKTGEALITRREGNSLLFMSPLRYAAGTALSRRELVDRALAFPAQKAVKGESGSGISIDYRGREVLAAWRYIPFLRWGLVAKIDAREAFAPVRELKILSLSFGVFMAFAGVLAALVFARAITGPIRSLQKGAEAIAAGDLNQRVGTEARDEVGQLSRAFDTMTDAIDRRVRERTIELEQAVAERKQAEEVLRRANAYNRSLLEASLDPLVTIDANGKITDVNAATEQATGLLRDRLIGTDFSDYFTDPSKARTGYLHVFKEGSIKDYSLEIRRSDGHVTPVLYNASVYRDEEGDITGIFAAARDMTDRKRAEELARLDEARTASILKISQYSAASMKDLLDLALDEAIALTGSKFGYLYFYHEETRKFTLHAWSREVMTECAIENPQTDYELEKTGLWGEVVRQRKPIVVNDFSAPHPLKKGCPDGHAPLSRFFSVPVFSEGRIVAVVGFANRPHDYTERDVGQMTLLMDSVWKIVERRQAEEKLKLANAYNRSLLESSLDPLVTISADGKITDVNLATETATGRSRENLLGTDFSDYFTDPAKAKAGYERVFREGSVMDYELQILRRDGRVIPVLYNAAVYRDEHGSVVGVFAAARDVTELKKAESKIVELNRGLEARVAERTAQLEAANKELEAFAYSVSHDLRTPLRSIDGFSRALLEDYADKLDDEGKGYLNRVRSATQRMARLIDDLLKLSRITRSEMSRERVDLSRIARTIADNLKTHDPERSAEFVIAEGLAADGDERLLTVMLENLITNSWKFTEKKPRAVIEFGAKRTDGETVYFIRDNGAGFDMTYVDKLFSPFQRLHREADFSGTGIGLATVKRIVTRHGGTARIEGEPDKGTTVFFTLG
jgi:PAS domain S-box-containing protein